MRLRTLILSMTILAMAASGASAATTGFLRMTSDPGDSIGLGQSYSFSFPDREVFSSASASHDAVEFSLSPTFPNGQLSFWSLRFDAPDGTPLAPGTYANARSVFDDPNAPGLGVGGDGRGCNEATGSFTVHEAAFTPAGGVVRFHASFEQHCEGREPALRGELIVTNDAVGAAPNSTVVLRNGKVSFAGTLTCTQPTDVTLTGMLEQSRLNRFFTAPFSFVVPCTPGAPVPWQIRLDPPRGSFRPGPAYFELRAESTDGLTSFASDLIEVVRPERD